MEKYNLDKLVKVECNDSYESIRYYYQDQIKFLGIVIRKEGFYENLYGGYMGLKIPNNHTFKNGIVYEKPEVILHYQDSHSKVYYFNSFDEAQKFADDITSLGKWQS